MCLYQEIAIDRISIHMLSSSLENYGVNGQLLDNIITIYADKNGAGWYIFVGSGWRLRPRDDFACY